MDIETLKWIALAAISAVSWFMKRTIDKNEEDIQLLHKEVAEIKADYLHKTDFKEFKQELRGMFEELRKDIRSVSMSVCPVNRQE